MLVGRDGIVRDILDDENYDRVLYWLPDGRHLAALIFPSSGLKLKIINILPE